MKKEIYGFLGPRGTFSEEAAMLYCNEEDELVPLPSFNEIFESLKTGEITKGVIPVENSLEGQSISVWIYCIPAPLLRW